MEIDMLSEHADVFDEVFSALYTGIEPLYTLVDSIARTMEISKTNYFVLPAFRSADSMTHVFYFKVAYDWLDRKDKFAYSHYE